MSSATRIFLTGFMGSGKSSIGEILANVLGFDFYDLDKEIERIEGRRIKHIFASDGEDEFRRIESEALRELTQEENIVVALGGGSLIKDANLSCVKTKGVLVYLKLAPESLTERLLHSKKRPLILNKEGEVLEREKLLKRVTGMLRERQSMYDQAHIAVDLENEAIGKAVDKVANAISGYGI